MERWRPSSLARRWSDGLELRVRVSRTDDRWDFAVAIADNGSASSRRSWFLWGQVWPGYSRKVLRAARTRRVAGEIRLGRLRISLRHRTPGDDRDLVRRKVEVFEQVPLPHAVIIATRVACSQNAGYQRPR